MSHFKDNLALQIIALFCLSTKMIAGDVTSQNTLLVNTTECRNSFEDQGKIYLTEYFNYIMEIVTMYIVRDRGNGTLNTSALEHLMMNSSTTSDSIFNSSFPKYSTVLPEHSLSIFSNFSCNNRKPGGAMESYCKHPKHTLYPEKGLINLLNATDEEKRRVAAGLCNEFESQWDAIQNEAINIYKDNDLVRDCALSRTGEAAIMGYVGNKEIDTTSKNSNFLTGFVVCTTIGIALMVAVAGYLYVRHHRKRNVSTILKKKKKKVFRISQDNCGSGGSTFVVLDNPNDFLPYSDSNAHIFQKGENPCDCHGASSCSASTCEANAIEMFIVKSESYSTVCNEGSIIFREPEKSLMHLVADDILSVVSDEKETSSISAESDAKSIEEKKKNDWATAIDQESGDLYYYSRTTMMTTWDRPASFDSEADE